MRWDHMFADLEAQAAALGDADLRAEVADRARAEYGAVAWSDRLRAALGQPVTLRVAAVGPVLGELADIGPDWLLLAGPGQPDRVVALAAVLAARGLAAGGRTAPTGRVGRALDLRWMLRGLAGQRAGVRVTLGDGSVLTGTIDRVGRDFVEIAEHAAGEPRRATAVRAVQTVPLAAVVLVTVLL